MASSTVENYIKQVYLAEQRTTAPLVPMGVLAQRMGVTPGTATTMVKTLAEANLLKYEPRSGVTLTKGGNQLALHVLRRHRLVELFLVEILGLDWSEVHPEAETLEHVISDRVLERIDDLLGHPSTDPHGDPIPAANGEVGELDFVPLNEVGEAGEITIGRILNQEPAFLKFLDQSNLSPGTRVRIESINKEADSITLDTGQEKTLDIGMTAAAVILVATKS